jgi:hypothetical protein
MNKLVCLKYVDGLTSKTEVLAKIPNGVHFDPTSKLWWITGAHIWVKTHIGGHLLYQEKEGIKCVINFGTPGAVIGIYDVSDPEQVKIMRQDARLAVKPQLP